MEKNTPLSSGDTLNEKANDTLESIDIHDLFTSGEVETVEDTYSEDIVNVEGTQTKTETKGKIALYVLCDDKHIVIHNYMNNNNMFPYVVSSEIAEVNKYYVMDQDDCALMVIEAGTGKFSGTVARKQLIELIGARDDSIGKIAIVFYSDSAIKADTERKLGKNPKAVEWVKYTGLGPAIEYIKKKKFVLDNADTRAEELVSDIENYRLEYEGTAPQVFDFSMSDGIEEEVISWSSREDLTTLLKEKTKEARKRKPDKKKKKHEQDVLEEETRETASSLDSSELLEWFKIYV